MFSNTLTCSGAVDTIDMIQWWSTWDNESDSEYYTAGSDDSSDSSEIVERLKEKLVKGSWWQLPSLAAMRCPKFVRKEDGWKGHGESNYNLCQMKEEMYSDSYDSESE